MVNEKLIDTAEHLKTQLIVRLEDTVEDMRKIERVQDQEIVRLEKKIKYLEETLCEERRLYSEIRIKIGEKKLKELMK